MPTGGPMFARFSNRKWFASQKRARKATVRSSTTAKTLRRSASRRP
jgi:hypothetical protein